METLLTPSTSEQDQAPVSQTLTGETPPPDIPEPEAEVPSLTLHVMENCVKVTDSDGMSKFLAIDAAITSLVKFLSESESTSGKVEHYPEGLIYRERTPSSTYLLFYRPESHQNLAYGSFKAKIVVPHIVLGVSLSKTTEGWKVSGCFYAATNLPLAKMPRERISASHLRSGKGFTTMPFTNVYNDGRLCYGGNSMPVNISGDDFRQLGWYYDVLWNSPFNDDLGIYSLRTRDKYPTYLSWFEHLAKLAEKNEPFPYDDLNWG